MAGLVLSRSLADTEMPCFAAGCGQRGRGFRVRQHVAREWRLRAAHVLAHEVEADAVVALSLKLEQIQHLHVVRDRDHRALLDDPLDLSPEDVEGVEGPDEQHEKDAQSHQSHIGVQRRHPVAKHAHTRK